jgi:2-phosphosulfolactate phosphatase
MTPPITHRSGIAGVTTAEGATLVIDTFRAFSTAAYLFDAGVARLILTDTLDEARLTAGGIDEALLCGENEGIQPADFDLGNSPAQVTERTDLAGRTIVMRTSAGSRSVVAAASAGASPIYATSLVVASATAAAVADEPAVTIVAAGLNGVEPADEDDATANLLEALLTKTPHRTEPMIEVLLAGTGAQRLLTTPSIDDRDLDLCLAVDAFDFPMEVTSETGFLVLKRG